MIAREVPPSFGPGREFARIRSMLADLPVPPGVVEVGPGDDGAVLRDGLVLSTDMAIESVHFRMDWITPREAGWRSAVGGMSDLAAMAARPTGILISLATPRDDGVAEEVMAGVRGVADRVGAALLGGDLTRSPGPIVIDVVSVGRCERPLRRSGAHEGDELWVTGLLGGAAGAVALWGAEAKVPDELRSAFVAPNARLREARWLLDAGATAGIDLSDGIAGDAAHLGAMSGLAVVLDASALPVHPVLHEVELPGGLSPVALALHGGDDFELAIAVPPGVLGERVAEFEEGFGLRLTRVGRMQTGAGIHLEAEEGADPAPLARGGFDHFGAMGSRGAGATRGEGMTHGDATSRREGEE